MNIFEYIGTKKLNDLIIANPFDQTTGKLDVTKGPDKFMGLLGSEYKFSEKTALKISNTTVGTLFSCVVKMVRIDPAFGTVNLTDMIVGRPLFWSDTVKFLVTPLASATARLAGICMNILTASNNKGDIIPIVTHGDVGVLLKGALTKASPVANDPVVLNVTANLGTADVLADATNWTNVQLALRMGRVVNAWNGLGGTVARMHLDNVYKIFDNGAI